MASESETMLPCPMCGESAKIAVMPVRDGMRVGCWQCGAHAGSQFHARDGMDGTRHRAIAAWNRRAPSAEAKDGFVLVPKEATPAMIAAIALAAWNAASPADIAKAREAVKPIMLQMQLAPGSTLDDVAHSVATFFPAWRAAVAAAIAQQPAATAQDGEVGRG